MKRVLGAGELAAERAERERVLESGGWRVACSCCSLALSKTGADLHWGFLRGSDNEREVSFNQWDPHFSRRG